jgi:general stress protein YciG
LLFLILERREIMAGTKAGAKKAAATNLARHGKDFYANIGRKGGKNGHTGGFAANRELAKIAGQKGGRISRRGPAKAKSTKITVVGE